MKRCTCAGGGTRSLIPALFLVCGFLLCRAGGAWAQPAGDKAKAKEHFLKGKALAEEGAYEKAIVELKTSYDLNPLPLVVYNIAVSYDKLHRYAPALAYYLRFLAEGGKIPEKTRDKVDERVENAKKFVGLVKIELNVQGAEVLIDGEAPLLTPDEELFLDAGKHEIHIALEGYEPVKEEFKVISGETHDLAYALVPVKDEAGAPSASPGHGVTIEEMKEDADAGSGVQEASAPKQKRRLGPAAFSVFLSLTAAAAITGTVTGILAFMKSVEVEDMYANENWKPLKDETRKLAITTDVMLGVALAGLGGAIVTGIFTDFKKKEKNKVGFMPALWAQGPGLSCHVVF